MNRSRRVARVFVAAAAALTGICVGTSSVGTAHAALRGAGARRRQPGILFVLADDLDLAEMSAMPEVRALLERHGATFDQYSVSDSLCCPSRTTTLRGQYAHNTGVLNNGGVRGGFKRAYELGLESSTIATRLHAAGYRTGLFGKYLNGYPHPAGKHYVPPGWVDWASPVAGDPYSEYDYTLNHNGRMEVHGHEPEDYGTDVSMRLARQFVERAAARDQPFFAYVSVFAPHTPATPAPADVDRFAGATAPRTPSFDQADVSDMPLLVRSLPQFTPDETAAIDRLYQRRLESLQAVDRGIADLVGTLRALGRLKDTYVVFASDNGFHLGQHRLPAGKEMPYDTDIRVPLVIRGPGIPAGSHVDAMADNADLAPTFSAMGGAGRARRWDGRSLLRLARGKPERGAPRRDELVEHWELRPEQGPVEQAPPDSVLEPADVDQADPRLHPTGIGSHDPSGAPMLSDRTLYGRLVKIPDYVGVRTDRYLYVEYANGDRELYDVSADPDEMHNLAGTDPTLEANLSTEVQRLRSCRRAACRAAARIDPTAPLGVTQSTQR